MGWSSGTTIVEKMIDIIQENVGDPDKRFYMYLDVIDVFENADWDNIDEVMGKDPEFDRAAKQTHPDWDWEVEDEEEFDECRLCFDEHPVNVLDDGLCPGCVDEDVD